MIELLLYQCLGIFQKNALYQINTIGMMWDDNLSQLLACHLPYFTFSFPTRINSCPNNCSEHGKCTTSLSIPSRVYCECDKYWKGEACDIPYCKANCGSPDHGYCDLTGEKLCVCNDSWQGKGLLFAVKSVFNERVSINKQKYLRKFSCGLRMNAIMNNEIKNVR